jgi:NADH-quinone oxidoreductase subunit A
MTIEFCLLVFFIGSSFTLALLLFLLTYNLKLSATDSEKSSVYECGFTPLSHTRQRFDIKFYLVAILFIIFDIEIAFLFPWTICAKELSGLQHLGAAFFVFLLTLGFIYEWISGALRWH